MFLRLIITQFVLAQRVLHHSEMVPIGVQGSRAPFPLEQISASLSSSCPGSSSAGCSPGAKGRLMLENFSFCEQRASELVLVSDSRQARVHQSFLLLVPWSQHPTTFRSLNKKGEASKVFWDGMCVLFRTFFLFYKPKHPNNIFKLPCLLHYHNTEDSVVAASSIFMGSAKTWKQNSAKI